MFGYILILLAAETSIVSSSALIVKAVFGLGIVLDVAEPDQQVPMVERKIRTIKERVRAHENSLPHVMPRLMLTICVLFSKSRQNLLWTEPGNGKGERGVLNV